MNKDTESQTVRHTVTKSSRIKMKDFRFGIKKTHSFLLRENIELNSKWCIYRRNHANWGQLCTSHVSPWTSRVCFRRKKMKKTQEIPTMSQLWKHAAQYYKYQTYVLTAFGAVGFLTYVGSSLISSHSHASSSASFSSSSSRVDSEKRKEEKK